MDSRETRAGNLLSEIINCQTHDELRITAMVVVGYYQEGKISREQYEAICLAGKERRKELTQ